MNLHQSNALKEEQASEDSNGLDYDEQMNAVFGKLTTLV